MGRCVLPAEPEALEAEVTTPAPGRCGTGPWAEGGPVWVRGGGARDEDDEGGAGAGFGLEVVEGDEMGMGTGGAGRVAMVE